MAEVTQKQDMDRNKAQVVSNPANEPEKRVRAPRISMAGQRQRLSVPDIPGYYLHWFVEENVPAAKDAYYEFVKRDELSTNPIGIGSSVDESGNTDLGSNVSLVAGQSAAGFPVRLHLMKLKMEYHEEDQRLIEQKNAVIMQAMFGDEARVMTKGGPRDMNDTEYRGTALFNRPKRKLKKPTAGTKDLRARLERLEKMAERKD